MANISLKEISSTKEENQITANAIPFVGPYFTGTAPASTKEAIPTGYDPTQYIPTFYLASNSWPIAAKPCLLRCR
jgi:hypothetical protein